MIDLDRARALIAAAAEPTARGLEAREELVRVAGQMAGEIESLRRIRLGRATDAVDPAVHTPQRVLAHLHRLGWVREGGGRVAELWHPVGAPDKRVAVPLIATAPDYVKVLGFLVSDLAGLYGLGELAVLAGIEAEDA